MVDLGIDYIFANLGTDHVSLIEKIAHWDTEGRQHQIILCPHEVVAVHMAGGYALATGQKPGGFVHVDAGVTALVEAAKQSGVPLKVIDIPAVTATPAYEHRLVLARADQHVA